MTSPPEEESAVRRPDSVVAGESGASQTPAESAEQEAVEADLDSLLEDVKRERDEYLELAQRARADFENFRKRAARETEEADRRAKARIARELVPVIDNLSRALEAAAADDPLRKGVELVHRELASVLDRADVVAYDPTGEPFDPNLHEALATRAEENAESGAVVDTLELGYRLDGQVIRPARVVVAE